MLGVVGLLVPEVYHLPFFKTGTAVYDNFFQVPPPRLPPLAARCCFAFSTPLILRIPDIVSFISSSPVGRMLLHLWDNAPPPPQIPPESLGQIALAIGLVEVFSHKGKITPVDMFEDGRKPGEFGFDPLGFGKNPADFKVLQVIRPPHPTSPPRAEEAKAPWLQGPSRLALRSPPPLLASGSYLLHAPRSQHKSNPTSKVFQAASEGRGSPPLPSPRRCGCRAAKPRPPPQGECASTPPHPAPGGGGGVRADADFVAPVDGRAARGRRGQ